MYATFFQVEDVDGPSRGEAKEKEYLGVDSGAEISKRFGLRFLFQTMKSDVEDNRALVRNLNLKRSVLHITFSTGLKWTCA